MTKIDVFSGFLGAGKTTLIKKLIKEAYERTVAKAGKASVPYCNSILEDWYANGIKTPEDVKAAAEGKKNAAQVRGSFETDDFFGAALNRSMAGIGEK